jgi:hypothetical protein
MTMFRFTIRDVLWLMVVVGLACALIASWRDTQRVNQSAKGWRTRAGALEAVLVDAGWKVRWEEKWIRVRAPDSVGRNGHIAAIVTDHYEPSSIATDSNWQD